MDQVRRVLVVNADDFGYCEQRNKGVMECFEKGAISSATIMVNAQATQQGFQLAKQHGLPLGLHFNVTDGLPLSPVPEVSSLLGSDGFFRGMHGFTDALASQSINLDEVGTELEAQLEAFRTATGQYPVHVDGHHHIHVWPGVAAIFAKVLAKKGIKSTRLPLELGLDDCEWIEESEWHMSLADVVHHSKPAGEIFRKAGIRFTDGFVGMVTMGANMALDMTPNRLSHRLQLCFTQLDRSIQTSPLNPTNSPRTDDLLVRNKENIDIISCELMVHPGYPCTTANGGVGQGPDEFAQSADRLNEIKVLTGHGLWKFCIEHDIALCTFGDLI